MRQIQRKKYTVGEREKVCVCVCGRKKGGGGIKRQT